jgi:hypothetical protein
MLAQYTPSISSNRSIFSTELAEICHAELSAVPVPVASI